MYQGVEKDIRMSHSATRMHFPLEEIGPSVEALNAPPQIHLRELPPVRETDPHVRVLFVVAVQGEKVVGIGALRQHPDKVEPPARIL